VKEKEPEVVIENLVKVLKQDWLQLLIYVAVFEVLFSANIQISDWQLWAIFCLFVLHDIRNGHGDTSK